MRVSCLSNWLVVLLFSCVCCHLLYVSASALEISNTSSTSNTTTAQPVIIPATTTTSAIPPTASTSTPSPSLSPLPTLSNASTPIQISTQPTPAADTTSSSSSSSSLSSFFTLFGTASYTDTYVSRLSLMTFSVPSLWRLELMLPNTVSAQVVEFHELMQNADKSFTQPAASQYGNSALIGPVYTVITNPQGLLPYVSAATNVALNYSLTSAANGSSLLSTLYSSTSATSVQLNYLMSQSSTHHFVIDYIQYTPTFNQKLWYYFTIHNEHGGQDTQWTAVTQQEAEQSLPQSEQGREGGGLSAPSLLYDDNDTMLDTSTGFDVPVVENGFEWQSAVVADPVSVSSSPSLSRYVLLLSTNMSSVLLWLNADYQINGERVQHVGMTSISSTQWVHPLELSANDVVLYNFTFWSFIDNGEKKARVWTIYRAPSTDAQTLIDAATAPSRLPGNKIPGDGSTPWSSILASAGGLPTLSSLGSNTALGNTMTGTLTAGLSSLQSSVLSGLNSIETAATAASTHATPTVTINSVPTTTAPPSVASVSSPSVSAQSLSEWLTPFSIVSSLMFSPVSSSSPLSKGMTYVNSVACVFPCGADSANVDQMVSCLGDCAAPFFPGGTSSQQVTSVINQLHDWIVDNLQATNISLPTDNDNTNNNNNNEDNTVSNNSSNTDTNNSSNSNTSTDNNNNNTASASQNQTTSADKNTTSPSNSSAPASSTSSTSAETDTKPATQTTPGARTPRGADPNPQPPSKTMSDRVRQWLTGTEPTPTQTNTPSSASPPSLGPFSSTDIGRGLGEGLGTLSGTLLTGLSALGLGTGNTHTQTVAITANNQPRGRNISTLGGASLPLSSLSFLFTPFTSSDESSTTVHTLTTYVTSLSCLLPCVSHASNGLEATSTCVGHCVNPVLPVMQGDSSAQLINTIDQWVGQQLQQTTTTPSTTTVDKQHSTGRNNSSDDTIGGLTGIRTDLTGSSNNKTGPASNSSDSVTSFSSSSSSTATSIDVRIGPNTQQDASNSSHVLL